MQINLDADKILIADRAVDFRKAIDGLCYLIVEQLKDKPCDGIYIFYNKRRDKVKIIGWHGNGFVLLYKRLEKHKFKITIENEKMKIDKNQLEWLLMGLDWQMLSDWKKPKFSKFL